MFWRNALSRAYWATKSWPFHRGLEHRGFHCRSSDHERQFEIWSPARKHKAFTFNEGPQQAPNNVLACYTHAYLAGWPSIFNDVYSCGTRLSTIYLVQCKYVLRVACMFYDCVTPQTSNTSICIDLQVVQKHRLVFVTFSPLPPSCADSYLLPI